MKPLYNPCLSPRLVCSILRLSPATHPRVEGEEDHHLEDRLLPARDPRWQEEEEEAGGREEVNQDQRWEELLLYSLSLAQLRRDIRVTRRTPPTPCLMMRRDRWVAFREAFKKK